MDTEEFRQNLKALETGEIRIRLSENVYTNPLLNRVAQEELASRERKSQKDESKKNVKIAKQAMISAWVAAIAAIFSAIISIIALFLGKN